MITLVLMPLLVYPLLSISFQKSLLVNVQLTVDEVYSVGVESQEILGEFLQPLLSAGRPNPEGAGASRVSAQSPGSGELTIAVALPAGVFSLVPRIAVGTARAEPGCAGRGAAAASANGIGCEGVCNRFTAS